MAVKYLLLHSRVRIPHSASLITTGRDDLIALRIELDLRYLILVTLEKRSAGTCEYIIDPSQTVCGSSRQLVTRVVESGVQHLIVVSLECFYALAGGDVP